ncbi:unnamed protein product [Brassica rapa]|uniref:CCHC-type domain-containing protein n=2 Tax=Brassica TaxID=3705 RepID=A0A3P5Z0N2_BRACM|nr:unnamed protein product [Brassica napus]CAG7871533.1 unnamed protein product [Brassica rapa]CDY43770.1 BnaA06g23060D [Brassica napus]VDC67463.1 unnamed protein product [Brassica rapa]
MPCDRWEDSIGNGTGNETTGYNSGGRGRRDGARGRGTSFVSATGELLGFGRRCFSCGDPSHFANAYPNRNSNGNF